ncbi:hypothetical protein GCM10017744_045020 [Streptomyces antimycoticus]|uniref:NAD-dependent epimerase/dehydratase domain-containing protein n=1 Tax=Streptomyces antimycoticus TaxID=68175 RepID=A0A4D4KDM9_9ACTN|nr:NAD(P)-dependent oxidoreductase [Streptomyces antimycoticus]GDY44856.1 hypothetical protein SANT12839_057380 [Streptomyces antimycoticus]
MILVTGGLGFIGAHTVRALLDLGEDCVVAQRRTRELPALLAGERVAVEQADITDRDALLAIGRRHDITGIVHLAASYPWSPAPDAAVEATRQSLDGLLNIAQAAQEWGVRRLGVASTIGVYFGVQNDGPLREDAPLPLNAPVSIPTFKKVGELLNGFLADTTGMDMVNYASRAPGARSATPTRSSPPPPSSTPPPAAPPRTSPTSCARPSPRTGSTSTTCGTPAAPSPSSSSRTS